MKLNIQSLLLCILFISTFTFATENDSTSSNKVNTVLSKKYLHISTTPHAADVYINNKKPDFSRNPDYVSPAFMEIQGDKNSVLLTLFKIGYTDTTINVTLSSRDTSYLIVGLQEDYDPANADIKNKILAKRKRKFVGHVLMGISVVPFLASAGAAIYSAQQIKKADNDKKRLNHSLIRDGENYDNIKENFKDHRNQAKMHKKMAYTEAIVGAGFLSLGLILSF